METAAALNSSGIALTEANRPYEAISLFEKALIIEPENPLLWLNLGIARQRTGDYEAAVECFYQTVNIDNFISEAWVSLGLIYYELEQFELAENCYCSALQVEENDPKVWNNMGALYFTLGNNEEARRCFEEAVRLAPMYYDALYNLRDTCMELNDYRAASEFGRILSGLEDSGSRFNSSRA
ncbi:MAG: tetratricopeptide repeat protein [Treponema sp.]|jgi:tetratricopeptide (TPR) repeat protein|nr:tetratricopeptide repeat protein [Treponema sp.]